MLLRAMLLILAVTSLHASPITWSITASSHYGNPANPVQADAYLREAFPFELDAPATLTFSATYSQSPHTCIGGGVCTQDLNTFSFTEPALYFDSAPHLNICNKLTGAPFPCSATLPAGTYDVVLEINDVLFTSDFIGDSAQPFTDTLTVTVGGLSAPEPAPHWTALSGIVFMGIVYLFASRRTSSQR